MELTAGSVGSESPTATAVVDLDGGRLASLTVGGLELMVTEGVKPTRWGSFPMVPWCGRLRDGELRYDGSTDDFPLTSPPHANHGFCHTQRWERTGDDTIRTELAPRWPFGGHVVQTFALSATDLRVGIEVHADDRPFPAMAGWHPWFRRQLAVGAPAELDLDLDRARVYEHAADGIPTGQLVAVPPEPWDNCFVGLGADPVVRWPGALDLTISSSFDRWVIFTEPEHALCVEPQSGAPNDINRAARIVTPDDPLVGWMRFSWVDDDGDHAEALAA